MNAVHVCSVFLCRGYGGKRKNSQHGGAGRVRHEHKVHIIIVYDVLTCLWYVFWN